jgi:hypothetical protein
MYHSASLRYLLGTFCSPLLSTMLTEVATVDCESELMLRVNGTLGST